MNDDTFYIMGTGLSVNDITDEEWKFLEDKNTIGFGGFAFSSKKTRYNYSHEGTEFDAMVLTMLSKNKYHDTTLILHRPESIKLAMMMKFKKIVTIDKGSALLKRGVGWFMDEEYPPVKLKECLAPTFKYPLFRFRGSLSAVINSALILGAKEIRLIGIDLDCMKDFYFDIDRWATDKISRKIIENKLEDHHYAFESKVKSRPYMYKDFDIETMHTTAMPYKDKNRWGNRELRGMLDVLWWIDKELREMGHRGIYVTNKRSQLYKQNKLEYKEIMEE